MAVTQSTDIFNAQVLIDAVRGRFRNKNAFIGSRLVSSGAVVVRGTMPQGGPKALNKTIDIPYWGNLPKFQNNPEGSSIGASKISQTSEQAGPIARSSLMVETSVLAQGVALTRPELGDPYAESADQAMARAEQEMDRIIVNTAKASPLKVDIYNASAPVYLEHRHMVQARSKFGDEGDGIVAMVTHSQALADLATMYNAKGDPMLVETIQEGQEGVIRRTFGGVPLEISDSVPLDGSTMGTVSTGASTTPPVATITGTPNGPWNLVIDCVVGGAHTTATIRFSTDGGNTWSATMATAGVGVALPLIDTAVDSMVGVDGDTGLSVAFAAGTFNADNVYTSNANLCVTSMMLQPESCAFWYNADRLGMKTDIDIAEDTDLFAMHLYYVSHMYRRRRMGKRPGVALIKHNVRNFVG